MSTHPSPEQDDKDPGYNKLSNIFLEKYFYLPYLLGIIPSHAWPVHNAQVSNIRLKLALALTWGGQWPIRADSRFASSQWVTSLLCYEVSLSLAGRKPRISAASVTYSTKEINLRLVKLPLNFSGGLDKLGLTPLVKLDTEDINNHVIKTTYNESDCVSNHQRLDWLLNRFFRSRSKKTSKVRVTGLCEGEFTGDRWIPRTMGQ